MHSIRVLRVILCMPGVVLATASAGASTLYWTDWSDGQMVGIKSADLDTLVIHDVIAGGLDYPYRLAVDPIGAKLYWTTAYAAKVQRANLDGSGVEVITDLGSGSNTGIAVDGVGGKVYWAKVNEVWSANLDGSDATALFTVSEGVQDLTLDAVNGQVYVSNFSGSGVGTLQRFNLDGTGLEDVVTEIVDGPFGLGVDAVSGKLYWGCYDVNAEGLGAVQRANLDGSGLETLVESVDADSLALDLDGGKVYWSSPQFDPYGATMQRCNLDGSERETLPFEDIFPAGIAIPEPGTMVLLLLGGLALMRPCRLTPKRTS